MFMSGDLGGTNFRISLFEAEGPLEPVPPGGSSPGKLLLHRRYRCADFLEQGFADMVGSFLKEAKEEGVEGGPGAACFSCAGPVAADNTIQMTNLPWFISGEELSSRFGVAGGVLLINDFVAAGYGLLTLAPHEYVTLQEGTPQHGAPIACLGAGTGRDEFAALLLRSEK